MSKVAVVTGVEPVTPKPMADLVVKGARGKGADVAKLQPLILTLRKLPPMTPLLSVDPAMGDEVLEEDEFQPMYDGVKSALSGKNVALFGSYGWGDGEWMRNWESDVTAAGAALVHDSVICNDAPEDDAAAACEALGAALA